MFVFSCLYLNHSLLSCNLFGDYIHERSDNVVKIISILSISVLISYFMLFKKCLFEQRNSCYSVHSFPFLVLKQQVIKHVSVNAGLLLWKHFEERVCILFLQSVLNLAGKEAISELLWHKKWTLVKKEKLKRAGPFLSVWEEIYLQDAAHPLEAVLLRGVGSLLGHHHDPLVPQHRHREHRYPAGTEGRNITQHSWEPAVTFTFSSSSCLYFNALQLLLTTGSYTWPTNWATC